MAKRKSPGRRAPLAGRYAHGSSSETEMEPGSGGLVLKNRLGIKKTEDMLDAEQRLLGLAYIECERRYASTHRFTGQDVLEMHRIWLGSLYPWAGAYRSVDISKGGFRFAVPRQIPFLMDELSRTVLARVTPCRDLGEAGLAQALAEVHVELILIHPFREGNGRVARLLADVMARQGGRSRLTYSRWEGRGFTRYLEAIRAGLDRNYEPMSRLFSEVLRDSSESPRREG